MTETLATHPIFQAIRDGDAEQVRSLLDSVPPLVNAKLSEDISALRLSILCDWPEVTSLLLDHGADPNTEVAEHFTALEDAVLACDTDLVRRLLALGADVRAIERSGRDSPILMASWNGDTEIVRMLLDAGADPNARAEYTQDTPLASAVDSLSPDELVELLISHGADPNAGGRGGFTPLFQAAALGMSSAVRVLLANGAHLKPNAYGVSPILAALDRSETVIVKDSEGGITHMFGAGPESISIGDPIRDGRTVVDVLDPALGRGEVVELLIRHFGRDALSIHDAVAVGNAARVEELLQSDPSLVNAQIERKGTPLHCAAGHRQMDSARILISHGADVNARACKSDHTPLHDAAESGFPAMLELLISAGADVNALDDGDTTPLHNAVCHPDAVRILLEEGADVHARDSDGAMALHMAVECNCLESVTLLVQAGADVNVPGMSGNTPLHSAGDSPEIARFLLDAGAGPNRLNDDGESPLYKAIRWGSREAADVLLPRCSPSVFDVIALGDIEELKRRLETAPQLLNAHDARGLGLLHYSAETGQARIAEYLLDQGLSPNLRDCRGDTPLHFAAESKGSEIAALLVARGADVNAMDTDWGFAPLHEAAYHCNVKVAELLIERGADVNATSAKGSTPVHQAECREIAVLLYRNGAVA